MLKIIEYPLFLYYYINYILQLTKIEYDYRTILGIIEEICECVNYYL